MKGRDLLLCVAGLLIAALCIRLAFWQISRLEEKRALNAARRAALAEAPLLHGPLPMPIERVMNHKLRVSGHYDDTRQILIPGHDKNGEPGAHVITPLALDEWGAVLVDRGFVAAADPAAIRPQSYPERGDRTVNGLADSIPARTRGATWRTIESDSVMLWSTSYLALDSLRGRLRYVLAPYVVRELPGAGVPDRPRRAPPEPLNEDEHLSYAIQWFLFALVAAAGPPLFLRARRAKPVADPRSGPPNP